jgi:dTDP-4-amino-4,6-dideoxygalactose transaminase
MPAHSAVAEARPLPSPQPHAIPVARPYMPAAGRILPYLERIDEARWYSNFGPLLLEFEARLAARFAAPAKVATTASGTLGLTLALTAMGARPGTLCAMPSWTFVATAHAALQAGLIPWFVDVDEQTWMLQPDQLRDAMACAPGPIGAVIPVCAFGRTPDLSEWAAFSADTGIPVLLDAAAAFDALDDLPVPAMVSLHATKVLGSGEGGFIAARDEGLIARVRELTSFGFRGSRLSHVPATNAKLSEYASAIGLASLDGWPAARLRYMLAAQRLRMALVNTPVEFQPGWGAEWISSVCVVRLPEGSADAIEARLNAAGVDTRRWWGAGCHTSPAFEGLPHTALPVTEILAASTIGLPFAMDLEPDEIERIAIALTTALEGL